MQSQSQGVSNQLVFSQRGKTGDDEGETKEDKRNPQRNLEHITWNDCGDKGPYVVNGEWSTQVKLKEDLETFRNMKQRKR